MEFMAGAIAAIILAEGHSFSRPGEVLLTRPPVGYELKVNVFGQYKDTNPLPAYVKWGEAGRRLLKPNDPVHEGEIIQTMGDGWLRILFKDDSILDVGPATMVQIKRYGPGADGTGVYMKMAYGRVRSIVTREVKGPNRYQIATPAALLGVRGTEFYVNVYADEKLPEKRESHTERSSRKTRNPSTKDTTSCNERRFLSSGAQSLATVSTISGLLWTCWPTHWSSMPGRRPLTTFNSQ